MSDNIISFCCESLSIIKQLLYICNNSIEGISRAQFSLPEMQHYKKLCLGVFHTNRVCNMCEYILSSKDCDDNLQMQTYDINNLLELMTGSFKSTVAEYIPIKLNYYTKLRHSYSVMINQRKFENLVLNILHCCIDNNSLNPSVPVKITIYATETKDSIVFHIRDNNSPINSKIIDTAFSDNLPNNIFTDKFNFASVATLTLATAKKSALELSGRLSYSPLKSGNRFDIYLPKYRKISSDLMHSSVPYLPSMDLFFEIFADIRTGQSMSLIYNSEIEEAKP